MFKQDAACFSFQSFRSEGSQAAVKSGIILMAALIYVVALV